jgi:hypothetical protein
MRFWNRPKSEPAVAEGAIAPGEPGPLDRPTPRRRRNFRVIPAWAMSLAVHVMILLLLTLASFAKMEVPAALKSFDVSPFDTKVAPEQVVHLLADPADDPVRTLSAASMMGDLATAEAPSVAPTLTETGKYLRPEDLLVDVTIPKLTMEFAVPKATEILEGRTGFKGDVQPAAEVGEALDQLAREILVRLARQRVVVAWLFDESESMRDDQQALLDKFEGITKDLQSRTEAAAEKRAARQTELDLADDDPQKKAARRKERSETDPLRHIVIGFGEQYDLMQPPTADQGLISSAVNKLRTDTSGIENTFSTVAVTLQRFGGLSTSEQQLIVVIVTDESGDDIDKAEPVLAECKRLRVPVFVIGRQSMFGTDRLQYRWVDPQTREVYWVAIRRGPETAFFEALQWDGLHRRREDQPSGFAPYDLARLTKETGGRYFLLPTAENERVRQLEKAYDFSAIRELSPDYEGREPYLNRRNASRLRSTMAEIIRLTTDFGLPEEFSVDIQQLLPALVNAGDLAIGRFRLAGELETRLRGLERDRDRDPERRWQANYDLMLAQLVYSQVKLAEYAALMQTWIAQIQSGKPPELMNEPNPERIVLWHVGHSNVAVAPPDTHEQRIATAKELFAKVIERYPNSPWADLSRDCLAKGFSVGRSEILRSPLYQERARFVPKF